jgi:hypothetical protein
MASNKELIVTILALALDLEIEPPEIAEKNNAQLTAILKELKASAEDPEPEPEPKFYIVAGKAITSKRGILSDGDEIKESDLPGGLKAVKAFVKSGYVVKK